MTNLYLIWLMIDLAVTNFFLGKDILLLEIIVNILQIVPGETMQPFVLVS